MWDIKLIVALEKKKQRETFHLNHVGYKGDILCFYLSNIVNFHLNHVGYKVENSLIIN